MFVYCMSAVPKMGSKPSWMINAKLSKYGDKIRQREFRRQICEKFVCNRNMLILNMKTHVVNKVCNDFCPLEFSKLLFEGVKGQL